MPIPLQEHLKNKECFLTCYGRVDGVGAQFHAIMSVMIAAKYLGFKYVHSPMKRIDHNDTRMDKEKWVNQWVEFFNMGESEMTPEEYQNQHPNNKNIHRIEMETLEKYSDDSLGRVLTNGHMYLVKKAHSITQKYHDDPKMKEIYHETILNLQQRYNKTKKPSLKFYDETNDTNTNNGTYAKESNVTNNEQSKLNVAVHIRRGDVARGDKIITKKRFKENEYFYKIMLDVEKILLQTKTNYQFHIFSEGTLKEDFPELHWCNRKLSFAEFREDYTMDEINPTKFQKPIQVHLNGDPKVALHHLVSADIIVMSKSCYSFIAGILNPNSIKIYTKFWFKPVCNDWIVADETGTINLDAFKSNLII